MAILVTSASGCSYQLEAFPTKGVHEHVAELRAEGVAMVPNVQGKPRELMLDDRVESSSDPLGAGPHGTVATLLRGCGDPSLDALPYPEGEAPRCDVSRPFVVTVRRVDVGDTALAIGGAALGAAALGGVGYCWADCPHEAKLAVAGSITAVLAVSVGFVIYVIAAHPGSCL
jgi:hypothetical protein